MTCVHSAVAACLPHGIFDLLFALAAEVLSEAAPMKNREAAPEMAFDPVLGSLDLASAHHARIHR